MDGKKINEEKLREAACYGDEIRIRELIESGVNINSQNGINGWSALHWAAKRGLVNIAKYLLENGADKKLVAKNGELPANVTDNEEILSLLGSPANKSNIKSDLPITPNYMSQTPVISKIEPENTHNNSGDHVQNGVVEEEIVLKVRIAHSSDTDFIEVEIPKHDLTYSRLLRVCCEELGIDLKQILKIRKLPDTVVRKDKDVRRLQDLQEIELVLTTTTRSSTNGQTSQIQRSEIPYPPFPGTRSCTILY